MKKIRNILCLCLLIFMSGCSKDAEIITQKEWLKRIAVRFYGVDEQENWQEVLVDYEVILDLDEINEYALSQSYAAKILGIAANLDNEEIYKLNDKNISQICLDLGIFDQLKKENETVTYEEAQLWIDRALQIWQNPDLNNYDQSTFKEDFLIIDEQVLNLNELGDSEVLFMRTEHDPSGSFYRIFNEENQIYLNEIDVSEVIESIDFSYQGELDFSDAIILDVTESRIEEFNTVSTTTITSRTFDWEGFKITWRLLNNGIKVTIEKKDNGTTITDQISISNITPSIRWKSSLTNIEHAFVKLNYTASNSLDIEKDLLSGDYFDTKKIVAKNWQIDLNALAEKTSSIVEQVIPIAKILVPLPNAPYLNLELLLQAKLSADGEVSIAVSSSGLIGFEITNNKIRILDEVIKNASCDINAKLSALIQIESCLNIANRSLADLSFDVGVGATMSMIGHLKNADGQISDAVIGLGSLNILSDLIHSDSDQEILICGDLSAHWIAKLNLNSSKTLAYKVGLSFNRSILNESNAPLFDKTKLHIENFKFVDRCTWNPAKKKNTVSYLDIDSYQYSIKVQETKRVEITNLPPDTSRSDLIFSSLDESIARIDDKGMIQGIKEGSTRIFVKTKDNDYQISAAVIVVLS